MKKKLSLKWKIGLYLAGFAGLLVVLLFVFQIVLLEPMYEQYKIKAVQSSGDEIAAALDTEALEETIMRNSMQNDMCITVTYSNTETTMRNQQCTAFANMTTLEKTTLIGYAAVSKNKTYTSVSESNLFENLNQNDDSFRRVIYTRIAEGDEGTAVIMIYSGISPINAATSTLKMQLLYISGIILLAVVLLTVMINRSFAKPLAMINEAAKQLPSGQYDVSPKTNRYKEAEELNQTLKTAASDIKKADKAKRDLIANVSHDLRTPLTMISGYGEMMRDLPGEKTDENIQVIIDESRRLTAIVNDLLDLSKLQENRIVLNQEVFDLTGMIETEIRKYDVYHYQDGFDIEVNLAEEALVNADRKRMEQVFNNFIINAINYSGNSRRIIINEKVNNGIVRTEIQDFGEGIAKDKIGDIWDRYYKVDKEHVRVTQGSGIGLSIVKEILDLHHAKYGVVSEEGKGSTFWFEMPVEKKI